MLGNLVLRAFDHEMSAISESNSYKYTRYADDLTFSSNKRIPTDFLTEVTNRVEAAGFILNDKKSKFIGLGDRMEVTGVVINDFPNMSREWRNWARGFLHKASMNPIEYSAEWTKVSGIFGTLKSLDPTEKLKLTRQAKLVLNQLHPKKK